MDWTTEPASMVQSGAEMTGITYGGTEPENSISRLRIRPMKESRTIFGQSTTRLSS